MYVLALISIAFKVCSHLGNIPLSTSISQSMINESKTVVFAMSLCAIGILGQVWYLIVSIPYLCTLTYLGDDALIS